MVFTQSNYKSIQSVEIYIKAAGLGND